VCVRARARARVRVRSVLCQAARGVRMDESDGQVTAVCEGSREVPPSHV